MDEKIYQESIQKLQDENKVLYMKVVGVISENIGMKKDKESLYKIIKNQSEKSEKSEKFVKIFGNIYWRKQ
jgi:hypothetical protein